MTYFTRFGGIEYNSPELGLINMPDLTKFAAIPDYIKNDPTYFLVYKIKDGERLDQISRRIYGQEDRLWIIMLMNDMWNISDKWPLNPTELDLSISLKYPFYSPNDIHHYEDQFGNIVDPYAGAILSKMDLDLYVSVSNLIPVTILDYETKLNDAKRNIKILDPSYIDRLENAMDDAFAVTQR